MRQSAAMYPFPIRIFDGAWHVLMVKPNGWVQCNNHHDARTLSRSQVLVNQAASNRRGGKKLCLELRATAGVLDRYGMGFGADLCRFYANGNAESLACKLARPIQPR
jgi:hypothetical protein